MTWVPPSDYRFPLTSFGLYANAASGTVGSLLVASPKVDYCMTPDAFVGGVPNTAPAATPSPSNCTDPNGLLGLSVGWGDLYDSEDAGNNIDISNVPDGTYWLAAGRSQQLLRPVRAQPVGRPTPSSRSPAPTSPSSGGDAGRHPAAST